MKRLIGFIAAIAAVLPLVTSCYEESIDTIVEWGFADDDHSAISNGLEIILPSAQTLLKAFDDSFYSEYEEFGTGHYAVMRAQSGRNKAIKNIKKAADRAVATLPSDFSCPINKLFVVRMRYSENEETVWSRSFLPAE